MAMNHGLIEVIKTGLCSEAISVSELNQNTKGVLEGVAKEGKQRDPGTGPAGATIITYRNEPEFLLVPIKSTPEYLQALAQHASEQASTWIDEGGPESAVSDSADTTRRQ